MPVVDVDLEPVVLQQAEALEGLKVRALGDTEDGLDLDLLLVIGLLEALRHAVDEVRRLDLDPVVERRLEVLGVVEGDRADCRHAPADRFPSVRGRIPDHGVLGHRQRPVRPSCLDLEISPEGDRQPRKRVVDDRGIGHVADDVGAVDIAESADRVPGGPLSRDPEVTHSDLVRALHMGFSQGEQGARSAGEVLRHVLEIGAGGEGLQRRDQPDPDGLGERELGRLPEQVIPLLLAGELALREPLG